MVFPLIATFASDNVWMKENTYREQPLVRFAHDLLVVLAGDSPADAVGWAVRNDLYSILPPKVVVPLVRASSIDSNHDGLVDTLKIKLDMPVRQVNSGYKYMQLLLVCDYELRSRIRAAMRGLLVVDVNAPYLATGVSVHGRLRLSQRLALPQTAHADVWQQYMPNPLDVNFRSNWAAANYPVTVSRLLHRYAERNDTVHFESKLPPVWDYSPRNTFTAEVTIDVAPEIVHYVPGAFAVLKFAWVQFVSFLLPTWIAVYAIKTLAFESQIVQTYIVPQLPSSDSM